jgi:putative peptidoglycan lipid II flippase
VTSTPHDDVAPDFQSAGHVLRVKLVGAAGLVALGALGSRLLGLVREPVTAYYFGRGPATDAYFVATTLSTIVYDLLVSGMVTAALVPVFSRLADREDRTELWDVASAIAAIAFVVLTSVVAVLMLAAPLLVAAMAGGATAEEQARTVVLARVMMPTILFMGLSGVCTALLYATQRYRHSALSVVCVNLGVIAGLVVLHRYGIISAAIGLLCGTVAQLGVQFVGIGELGVRFRPRLRLDHPEVMRIGQLYAPVAMSFVLSGVVTVIDRNLYTHVGPGALSASAYATRLVQVPLGLVSTALSMAILPTLSRYASMADLGPYKRMLTTGIKLAVLLMLPATVGLAVLRAPALALLFQRGEFSSADTSITAIAFLVYAPQMPFAAVDQVLITAFYAMHDTRTPVVINFVTAGLYLAVAFALIAPWGMAALILANTVQNTAHAVLLFWLMRRKLQSLDDPMMAGTLGALALAGVAMGVMCGLVALPLAGLPIASGSVRALVTLAVAGGAGTAIYVGILLLARVPEARLAWQLAASRFSRGAVAG